MRTLNNIKTQWIRNLIPSFIIIRVIKKENYFLDLLPNQWNYQYEQTNLLDTMNMLRQSFQNFPQVQLKSYMGDQTNQNFTQPASISQTEKNEIHSGYKIGKNDIQPGYQFLGQSKNLKKINTIRKRKRRFPSSNRVSPPNY